MYVCAMSYIEHVTKLTSVLYEYHTCSCNQSSQLDAAALEGRAPGWLHIHSVLARFARL